MIESADLSAYFIHSHALIYHIYKSITAAAIAPSPAIYAPLPSLTTGTPAALFGEVVLFAFVVPVDAAPANVPVPVLPAPATPAVVFVILDCVSVVFVTSKLLPNRTVNPVLFTTFSELKFVLVLANVDNFISALVLPVVLNSI